MENSYGIGVANRYALLDDELESPETLLQNEPEKELKKKTKITEKENKGKSELPKAKPTANGQKKVIKDLIPSKNQENKRDDNKPAPRPSADGKADRPFKSNINESREDRNNRRNREDRPYNGPSENRDRENRPKFSKPGLTKSTSDNVEYENRNRDRAERGERGGERPERSERGERREGRPIGNRPGGPRGPRRTFDDRRGKREFDRQSGSDKTHGYRGVKPVEKRDGAGAHNWGSTKDLIAAEAERPANSDAEQTWGESDKPEQQNDAEKKEELDADQTPVEEEPKELTLDEWKAQRAGRIKPQYNIRKAGEGEDPSQWKKMFELKKKEKEEESDDEEYDVSEYPQRVGRQKHVLEIDIQFNDSRRPGGGRGRGTGRGGRGGTRGVGPRGPPRDRDAVQREGPREERKFREEQVDEKAPRVPKVNDERDFPSLG
ncbi:plasminogen activator inhibitor 1 RNA-binding protein isoform X2 [Dendroctonus ponderosae]|uniref:plasminogen activator inhibitor 1 RNA-binding protein isoform X2 n=1 Tax=Dendroctonus ponderosae TaxID=77166 RepID=UPI0020363F10|nr:plasminogen activator inhibitor 1 RNA-binding protein isoform X2 [Dendroctonus ponderosae]KAH1029654.1 hypothetical protein HUJ05_002850 [Dendroctonus ponderosae]KAH1029655.1 hypothetical protein HUJ05_002850 [Dendroctonus ponderosae]